MKPRYLPNNRTVFETMQDMRRPRVKRDTGWISCVDTSGNNPSAPTALPEGDPGSGASSLGVTPIMVNNWVNVASPNALGISFPPFGFHVDENGYLKFQGHIAGGVVNTKIVDAMPVGFRIDGSQVFIIANDAGGYAHIRADPDGGLWCVAISTVLVATG